MKPEHHDNHWLDCLAGLLGGLLAMAVHLIIYLLIKQ